MTKSGACALLDFGQMKVLRDEIQLLFARMIIAQKGNSSECVKRRGNLTKLDRSTTEIDKRRFTYFSIPAWILRKQKYLLLPQSYRQNFELFLLLKLT